jgi:hypothetical protein
MAKPVNRTELRLDEGRNAVAVDYGLGFEPPDAGLATGTSTRVLPNASS